MPFSRPTGLSQAKGVNKEVERHLKERVDWLVEQLHLHNKPDYVDGTMYLERRNVNVRFDGMVTFRANELPDWYVQVQALQSGVAPHMMAEASREKAFEHSDMTGALTAHLHGRHVARWRCARQGIGVRTAGSRGRRDHRMHARARAPQAALSFPFG